MIKNSLEILPKTDGVVNAHEMSMTYDESLNWIKIKNQARKQNILEVLNENEIEQKYEIRYGGVEQDTLLEEAYKEDIGIINSSKEKFPINLLYNNGINNSMLNILEYVGSNFTMKDLEYLQSINIKPILIREGLDKPTKHNWVRYEQIIRDKNIQKALTKCQKGKHRYKFDALLFVEYQDIILKQLKEILNSMQYIPNKYRIIKIRDKKDRTIKIPAFIDKLIHHCINNVLREYYEPKFIHTSYACIRKKGGHKAVLQLQHYLRSSLAVYTNPYLLKLDISKFYYSIDRLVLLNILSKDIKCAKTLHLIKSILFTHTSYWDKGLPLGNLTSQLFSNIYMHQFDLFIKRTAFVKYYVRYADDMFIIVEGKETAEKLSKVAMLWIQENLKLIINPKKIRIESLRKLKRITGLGFDIYEDFILPLNTNKRKFINYAKKQKIESMRSWVGYASIAKIYGFINNVINKYCPDIVFENNTFYYKPKVSQYANI